MPELPEVETIARQLDHHLRGWHLGRVVLSRRDIVHGSTRSLKRLLPGNQVQCVRRRGKRVILDLARESDPRRDVCPCSRAVPPPLMELVFHLGMTGQLTVRPTDDPLEPHTHLRIAIERTRRELRFRDPRRFGGVWCLTDRESRNGRMLGELGPEPLELTVADFRRLLGRKRQIKALLLDQRAIAGLGNIYCDETLHAASIHPLTRADLLDRQQSARLLRAIKTTLRRAIRFNGSTISDYRGADGQTGSFQRFHRVYQKKGSSCHTCDTPIERILAAGRSTFLCPSCQCTPKGRR